LGSKQRKFCGKVATLHTFAAIENSESHENSMLIRIPVDHEFSTLCKEILNEHPSIEQWREIEADDMFQSPHYSGGFDATEDAFCFSYYDPDGSEFWFQLTLSEMREAVAGTLKFLEARTPEV
jgi:hypothetical protein